MLWVLIAQVQIFKVRLPDVGYEFFCSSVRNSMFEGSFPNVGHYNGVGFMEILSQPLLSFWCGFFLICPCEVVVLLVFSSFSEKIVPYITVDLVCPWVDGSSGSSYVTTSNCLQRQFLMTLTLYFPNISCYSNQVPLCHNQYVCWKPCSLLDIYIQPLILYSFHTATTHTQYISLEHHITQH